MTNRIIILLPRPCFPVIPVSIPFPAGKTVPFYPQKIHYLPMKTGGLFIFQKTVERQFYLGSFFTSFSFRTSSFGVWDSGFFFFFPKISSQIVSASLR